MDKKQDKLSQLRNRAETVLKKAIITPDITVNDIHEVAHELSVYHVELEIQLEDLQLSYQALEIAKQQYAALFDFAPVGYIMTDKNGVVIKANRTAGTMLGVESQALEQLSFSNFITPDYQDVYHVCRRTVLNTRQAMAYELRLQHTDGSIFDAQLNTDIPDASSQILFTIITNISAIKKSEEALQRSLAHEQDVNQLRTRVLSVIAHEFRTPLTVILSAVETLDRYDDRLTREKKQERYQTIRNLVWYLNDMIHDARSINSVDYQPVVKFSEFEIISFVRQMVMDMESIIQNERKINLEIIAQREEEFVSWDQKLFRRIIMNLLNNAFKYSDKPVDCQLDCEESIIRLTITDQGSGISEEDQKHMYEVFYRGENVETMHGTGVGLFVVKRAVEAHGGSIRCESQVGKGTTFIIELPRQAVLPPET